MADGIEIPLAVATDGSEITIERMAASILDLNDKVERLGRTAESTKKAVQFTALIEAGRLVKDAWGFASRQFADFSAELDKASAFGSKFQNMALQFNTSAEALQKLGAAGKPFGVSVDQMARSLNLLDRNFAKIAPQFKKFGIDVREVTGAKDGADRFLKIAEGIGKIKDPAQQAAASFALLKDRSGAFLKLIRDPDGMKAAIKDFEDFGLAVSDNAVGALDKFGNQKQLIGDIFTSFKTNILGAIASSGAFQEAIRVVTEWFGKLSKWAKDNEATIKEWTTKAILVAIDVLIFLAGTVIPKVVDAFTGLRIIVSGLQAEFKILGDGVVLLWNILKNPLGAKDAWAAFKLAMNDTMADLGKKVEDAMSQNAAWQGTAKTLTDEFGKVRDRIANAAKTSENFAAPIKDAGDAAALTAEQIEKVAAATKAWEEKMQGVARATAQGFAELADKDLPEVEQKIAALTRSTAEQMRQLQEDFAKQNEALAKQGLPGLDSSSLTKSLDETVRLLQAKIADIQKGASEAIGDATEKRMEAMRVSIFGNFDDIEQRAQDLLFTLSFLDEQVGLTAADFDKMSPAALAGVVGQLEDMAQAAAKAGKEIAGLPKALEAARAAALGQAGDKGIQGKILQDQLIQMESVEAQQKKERQTRREIVDLWVKQGTITKEQAEKLLPKATTNAELFRDALEVAANAAQLLGESFAGDVVSGMLAAAAAGEQVAASIKAAKESGEGMGKALVQAAGAGIGVASNIYNKNKTELNGGKAALSGAAQGAAFGSQFGLVGGIVGGVAGGLIGFFAGSKFRKIAKDAGKVLGDGLSKETISKIQEDSKKLGVSIKAASLLNISTAMADTGKAASTYGPAINDLIKGIADKSIPAKEGLEELAKSFGAVADEALKAGRVGDKTMVSIIKQARASGVESPEIKAFVSEQLTKAAEGFAKFAALFKKQTKEEAAKLGEEADKSFKGLSDAAVEKLAKNTGVVFGAVFNALVSEQGIVGAVDKMKDSFETLRTRLSETLGEDAVNNILGPFGAAFATIGDEKLRPLFEGIDGLSQAMQGLANSGFLTLDQFSAIQQATKTLFDEAVAGGADMKTALLAVSPSIQAAISAAEQFGVPLDADTQKLKELAEQNGITFKTDPQQAMLDVMVAIAEVLGADIPESAKRAKAALMDLKNAAPDEINVGGGGASKGTGGPSNVQANVTVHMGINENPMAAADTAAAMRRQTVQWAAEAIEDRVPAIISAIEGN